MPPSLASQRTSDDVVVLQCKKQPLLYTEAVERCTAAPQPCLPKGLDYHGGGTLAHFAGCANIHGVLLVLGDGGQGGEVLQPLQC